MACGGCGRGCSRIAVAARPVWQRRWCGGCWQRGGGPAAACRWPAPTPSQPLHLRACRHAGRVRARHHRHCWHAGHMGGRQPSRPPGARVRGSMQPGVLRACVRARTCACVRACVRGTAQPGVLRACARARTCAGPCAAGGACVLARPLCHREAAPQRGWRAAGCVRLSMAGHAQPACVPSCATAVCTAGRGVGVWHARAVQRAHAHATHLPLRTRSPPTHPRTRTHARTHAQDALPRGLVDTRGALVLYGKPGREAKGFSSLGFLGALEVCVRAVCTCSVRSAHAVLHALELSAALAASRRRDTHALTQLRVAVVPRNGRARAVPGRRASVACPCMTWTA